MHYYSAGSKPERKVLGFVSGAEPLLSRKNTVALDARASLKRRARGHPGQCFGTRRAVVASPRRGTRNREELARVAMLLKEADVEAKADAPHSRIQ